MLAAYVGLSDLGPMLSPSWAYVGPSWGYVGPSWGQFEPMLELC